MLKTTAAPTYRPDMGTVEEAPYVGDSNVIHVTCAHGDFTNIYKGQTEKHGQQALAAHHAAKHPVKQCRDAEHHTDEDTGYYDPNGHPITEARWRAATNWPADDQGDTP